MESVNSPTGSASLPFFCGTTSPKTKNPKRLKAVWDFVSEFSLAEGEGFEPSIRYNRIPDFESGAFDLSATLPCGMFPSENSRILTKGR